MTNLRKVKSLFQTARTVLVTCHINPDGDAIGSMLALGLGLRALGKEVVMACSDGVPDPFHILPGARDVRKTAGRKPFDLAVSVDCNSPDMLGVDKTTWERAGDNLEIDHHEIRQPFGNVSFVDAQAAANGEIVYSLLKNLRVTLTPEIAKNILTALIVETNSFRLPQVREKTFRICADLMRAGVDFSDLTRLVYWEQRRESVLLTGVCLSRCRFKNRGQVVWSILRDRDFRRAGGKKEDVDAAPDIMRSIRGVKVAVFFREQGAQQLRVSLRSKDRINVAQLARQYGGGGHYDVAGCFIPNNRGTRAELLKKVSALVK